MCIRDRTDPEQYRGLIEELETAGAISFSTRARLAVAAFERSAAYDAAIHAELATRLLPPQEDLPAAFSIRAQRKGAALRYGENPHQRGAFYTTTGGGLASATLHEGGKALSYNNYLDLDGALKLVSALEGPSACVVKLSLIHI